jgi:membrane-associated phospholipid phosphatase
MTHRVMATDWTTRVQFPIRALVLISLTMFKLARGSTPPRVQLQLEAHSLGYSWPSRHSLLTSSECMEFYLHDPYTPSLLVT